MRPFSGKANRGFTIVAHIHQDKAFASPLRDPFDTRGRTPDPGVVAKIVASAYNRIAVRAHRQGLAIEFAARGEYEFFNTVNPLRSRSLAGWLVLPTDDNAAIGVNPVGARRGAVEKHGQNSCRTAINEIPKTRVRMANLGPPEEPDRQRAILIDAPRTAQGSAARNRPCL